MPFARQRVHEYVATAAEWTHANEILATNEKAIESDTGREKLGDGVTHYSDLDYISSGAAGGGSYEAATESPATGSNDTFTFTAPPTLVFRNTVMERSLGSVVGNTFVFDVAPNLNDVIEGLV
jgi:hypothetical protein